MADVPPPLLPVGEPMTDDELEELARDLSEYAGRWPDDE